MEANTSDFVTIFSSSLGKSVLNWYRAFSSVCEATTTPKTWESFKLKLRERLHPKDFEYNLRERLFQLKQQGTIPEYVSSFQDLMSQSELEISEMEKRFYFQNGLRAKTAKKGGKPAKVNTGPATSKPSTSSEPPLGNQKNSMGRKNTSKVGSRDEWTKTATCHNCGQLGHIKIKPQCKANKETNHYVSGSFHAIVESWASKQSKPPDNGSCLNGVTEELANQLQLDIIEHPDDLMTIMLGYNQTVQRPKRTVEMKLQIPDFPETC
ncbi:LOW QUALITY PROTEIN: hypothetical protein PHMEG_00017308 [Phytophthora megakarya]|uniref:Retrotransposon gag domain-containing protein n=1 Tax=Phytophthora megakarya TaxID=4795 RepID=A0A225VYD8_9STRA|nr:LOW QUALITY PROTEIN: hypothetical protein PHMEG_00017308 [Phytophthora megakarya]